MLKKNLLRTIKKSIGRYLAILAIIALGVGFFAGLRVTEETMKATLDDYLAEKNLYDYRLISTLGLTAEDVETFKEAFGEEHVSGSVSYDFILGEKGGADAVYHAHTLLADINGVDLVSGRLPEKADECLVDALFPGDYSVGSTIRLSDNNIPETRDHFAFDSYKVVGTVNSSEYINFQRGSTSLAGGKVSGFVYLPAEGFNSELYTEIYLSFPKEYEIYSEAYDESLDSRRDEIESMLDACAEKRYQGLLKDALSEINEAETEVEKSKKEVNDGREKISDGKAELASKRQELEKAEEELNNLKETLTANPYLTSEMIEEMTKEGSEKIAAGYIEIEKAEKELSDSEKKLDEADLEIADAEKEIALAREKLAELEAPTTFVLDRNTNFGYATFKNDITIVSGVAKVFPLFFFLVAALVCITTMTRMVGEKRSENGTLKALGFSNRKIAGQYLIYAGSASVLGCVIGFILGSKLMPLVLWKVYNIMYAVNRPAKFVFNTGLFVTITVIYLICILGITYAVCRSDLQTPAAGLMRPESPAAGKRILLERIGFIWRRMPFLHKVSARNIFRYKKRLLMMIMGIGGCTALLLTGLGIRDTIQPILDYQYGEISTYDASVSFLSGLDAKEAEEFRKEAKSYASELALVHTESVDATGEKRTRSADIVAFDEPLEKFVNLHMKGTQIGWPKEGEAVINYDLAKSLGLEVGDALVMRDGDFRETTVTVSGIYENYIGEVIYVTSETFRKGFEKQPDVNSAYLIFGEDMDEHAMAAEVLNMDNVMSVGIISDHMETVAGMLKSLDLIVLIVLVCAGALSFIVLFNLTNITITERLREIATLKVLGFRKKEQNAYIFRENIILTLVSAICGIPLGIALLNYVMGQIKIDGFYFGCKLAPLSYLYGILITMLFTIIVDSALKRKLRTINMAEAMKAVE